MTFEEIESKIEKYEAAEDALLLGGAATSYTLPTGVTVNYASLPQLREIIEKLYIQKNRSKWGICTVAHSGGIANV